MQLCFGTGDLAQQLADVSHGWIKRLRADLAAVYPSSSMKPFGEKDANAYQAKIPERGLIGSERAARMHSWAINSVDVAALCS